MPHCADGAACFLWSGEPVEPLEPVERFETARFLSSIEPHERPAQLRCHCRGDIDEKECNLTSLTRASAQAAQCDEPR